jgi:hypothetical protein
MYQGVYGPPPPPPAAAVAVAIVEQLQCSCLSYTTKFFNGLEPVKKSMQG